MMSYNIDFDCDLKHVKVTVGHKLPNFSRNLLVFMAFHQLLDELPS